LYQKVVKSRAYDANQLAKNLLAINNGTSEMSQKVLRLLLIEDSPSDVRLIKEALKESQIHCELSVASDGVEGLVHLRKVAVGTLSRPDLIILDLNLPRKNGREVLSEVKSSPRLKQIPVLVMTSSRSEDDVNEAYTLNANCFISKPYDLQEYIDIVRSIEEFWLHTATLPETDKGGEAVSEPRMGVRGTR
jgi:two-component system, chemotaxis family, response regulator Rcp1